MNTSLVFWGCRCACTAAIAVTLSQSAFAGAISIVNPGFETDAAPAVGATGWTTTSGGTDWFIADGNQADSVNDPSAAAEGVNWLSSNRLVAGAGSSNNPHVLQQLVDISSDASLIDTGFAQLSLTFQFSDSDSNDTGVVNVAFFSDVAGASLIGGSELTTGNILETAVNGTADAPWDLRGLSGAVPVGARSMTIEIVNNRAGGSAGNTHFDDFQGSIDIPEPSSVVLLALGGWALMDGRRRRCVATCS